MPKAEQVLALLRSHIDGDDERFITTALQVAAYEAQRGHGRLAQELRRLIDRRQAERDTGQPSLHPTVSPLLQPRGELANLLSVSYPNDRLGAMVLNIQFRERLQRILLEQSQSHKLHAHSLQPRRKLLLVGPPGSGKTLTASVVAGELKLPLFTILLENLITKFMGETALKLRSVFDAIAKTKAVYLFDEFDAIGTKRNSGNDVGEIRRILNSFLQLLENDQSHSIIIAATNHPELLDRALFRRFDDVLEYSFPHGGEIERLFKARLGIFNVRQVNWRSVTKAAEGLSQAEIARSCDEAAKTAILQDSVAIKTTNLLRAIKERRVVHS